MAISSDRWRKQRGHRSPTVEFTFFSLFEKYNINFARVPQNASIVCEEEDRGKNPLYTLTYNIIIL